MSASDLWEPLDVLSISISAGISELSDEDSWSGLVAEPLPKMLLFFEVASSVLVVVDGAVVGWSAAVLDWSVGWSVLVVGWSVGWPVVVLVWSVVVVDMSVGWPVVALDWSVGPVVALGWSVGRPVVALV